MTEDERTASGWDVRAHGSVVRFLEAIAAGAPGSSLLAESGVVGSVVPSAPDRSVFNSVVHADPLALEDSIERLGTAYREAGVRAWTVWFPEADRRSAELLEGRGHRLDGEPRSMILDLDTIPGPDELDFVRGVDWTDLCRVNDAAYGLDEGTYASGLGRRPGPGLRGYGARHGGWVAAVLATLLEGEDCGAYLVATLPEARRRGLAGRLLHRALLDARERGCRTSTLLSSPRGAGVYRRLGYQDLGALQMWEHRVFPA